VSSGATADRNMPPEQAKREIACRSEPACDGQERFVCDHLVTAAGDLVTEIVAVFADHGVQVRAEAIADAVAWILADDDGREVD
jgi:hypothetical protein